MIFWIFALAFTAGVLALVLRPLLRAPSEDDARTTDEAALYDVAVFKSQLQEIERDLARARISEEEAESSRIEIGRRLLAADKRLTGAGTIAPISRSKAGALFASFLIAVSLTVSFVLYDYLGDPTNPDMPLVLRQAEIQLTELAQEGARAEAGGQQGALDDQTADLRERLLRDGGDVAEWTQLGRAEMMRGAFAGAADAYSEALKGAPEDPDLNSAYGEALVFWANGEVTPQAFITFQRVLTLRPGDPRARFYTGDYERQEGHYRKAMDTWTLLLAEGGPNAPWAPVVRERAENLAAEMGLDLEAEIRTAAASLAQAGQRSSEDGTEEGSGLSIPGPTEEDIANAQALSPEDQLAMIEGMVERLAERMRETPEDLDGWKQLGRSYATLGRGPEALEALERASALAPNDASLLISQARIMRGMAGDRPTPDSLALMRQVEILDPTNLEALWFLGIDAAQSGEPDTARAYFERALATLPEDSPEHATLSQELRRILPLE